MSQTLKPGDIRRWDFQSDSFGGQYKLVANLGGGKWEIEHLPADDQTVEAIFDYWAHAEANGYMTTPIWDKTWKQCGEGESPQRIGWLTYEQMLERDLARYAEQAGTRTTIKLVSSRQWAEMF